MAVAIGIGRQHSIAFPLSRKFLLGTINAFDLAVQQAFRFPRGDRAEPLSIISQLAARGIILVRSLLRRDGAAFDGRSRFYVLPVCR